MPGKTVKRKWRPSAQARKQFRPYKGRKRDSRTASVLGIEKKYLDCYTSLVAIPAPTDCSGGEMQPEGGCTNCLSVPAQGDGDQQRDGKKCIMKSIFVTGAISTAFNSDQPDIDDSPIVFVALVKDK